MKIYLISLCILTSAIGNYGDSTRINCKNSQLNVNGCGCELPTLPGNILRVINSFDRWPMIPVDAKSIIALVLSANQIDSIDDLTNLDNLEFFNISYNRIRKINSSISTLQKLSYLDLSYNLLEEFRFEDLVPNTDENSFDFTKPIFGSLSMLLLNGNQIKKIFNFDLVFVALPLCNFITLDYNMLTSLDVPVLSNQSQNVIKKVKQALATNDSYLDIFEFKKEERYYYGFRVNLIKRFNVNFKVILNDVFIRFKKIFLTRFWSIALINEKYNFLCDCNTYLAFNFLIEQLGQVHGSEKVPDGDIQSFVCFQKDSNKPLNLFDLINGNQVNGGNFCAGNSSEYKWNIYDLNDASYSASFILKSGYFPQFFVEILILRLILFL